MFNDGDRVRVRDFLTPNKWQFGRIVAKEGKLRYQVRLDDGRLWERHVDHIVGVGVDLMPREVPRITAEPSTFPLHVPVTVTTTSRPLMNPSRDAEATSTEVQDLGPKYQPNSPPDVPTASVSVQQCPRGAAEGRSQVEPPLRRSNRTIKAPQRLDL